MPHLNIEYSANLSDELDIQGLVDQIHETAIANGDPRAGYIHVMVRIGAGRDFETRRSAGDRIFEALCDVTQELYQRRPLALSFELHEIPADMAWRKNNL